jgi:hypothetical protein
MLKAIKGNKISSFGLILIESGTGSFKNNRKLGLKKITFQSSKQKTHS